LIRKAFTSPDTVEHPDGVWSGNVIYMNARDEPARMEIEFTPYHDETAALARTAPVAGCVKKYSVVGAEFFRVVFSPSLEGSHYDSYADMVEAYAMASLDTPTGNMLEVTDASGNVQEVPEMVSFFHGCERF